MCIEEISKNSGSQTDMPRVTPGFVPSIGFENEKKIAITIYRRTKAEAIRMEMELSPHFEKRNGNKSCSLKMFRTWRSIVNRSTKESFYKFENARRLTITFRYFVEKCIVLRTWTRIYYTCVGLRHTGYTQRICTAAFLSIFFFHLLFKVHLAHKS